MGEGAAEQGKSGPVHATPQRVLPPRPGSGCPRGPGPALPAPPPRTVVPSREKLLELQPFVRSLT